MLLLSLTPAAYEYLYNSRNCENW